ncbi:phage anti-repressor protein [Bartonella silvatica]|uniref:Phage anti-repressor protein n=1 Tax=Bartonella silvatica TaxID=357760 RepID=A0ABV2HJ76_9HYPH
MSQYLIDINQTKIDGELVQTVNARDLHAFLEIKSEFRNWIKNRIIG